MIRLLKGNKDSATNSRTRAINQIKESDPGGSSCIATCAAFRFPAVVYCPFAAAKKALRYLARRVLQLEKEIAELLEDLDQLTQQACPGLRKTYGIAVDGGATLLVAAGDNPGRLRSDAAFAALCGVSPLPASSGKPIGIDSFEAVTARPMPPSITSLL